MLSPRLQSTVLDMACFPEGLDPTAAEAIWGCTCSEDAASLQSLGLVSCSQRSSQQPVSLTVHDAVKASGLHLADQAWARRVVSPDSSLAVLDLSKVRSDHGALRASLAYASPLLSCAFCQYSGSICVSHSLLRQPCPCQPWSRLSA